MEATIHCLVRFSTQMLGERHNSGKLNVVYEFYFLKKRKKWQPETIQKRKQNVRAVCAEANTAVTIDTVLKLGKVELKGCGLKVR